MREQGPAASTTIEQGWTLTYETSFSQVKTITDPASKVTTVTHDSSGNPTKIVDPLGGEQDFTYNGRGQVLTYTDQEDRTTTFTYDAKGNLATVTDDEGNLAVVTRDAVGNVTELTEGDGTAEERTRTATYDALNRILTLSDGAGGTTSFDYDDSGNLTEVELATGETLTRTYDAMERVSEIDDPAGGTTELVYDHRGNLTRTRDGLSNDTDFVYDAADQLTGALDAKMGTYVFGYDDAGNVESFEDPRGQETTFVYDLLNRQTSRTNPLSKTWTFVFDARDNLTSTTDPKSQTIQGTYDDLSRLTRVTTPDNQIDMTYDAVGNLLTVEDDDSKVTYTYDGLDRVLTAATASLGAQPAVTLTYAYDAVGNRISMQDSDGTHTGTTTYGFDGAGRMTRLTTPGSNQIDLDYDLAGRLTEISFPSGVTSTYGYDTNGRLDSIDHALGASSAFKSFAYAHNAVGNITSITDEASTTRSFTYDELHRLITGGTTSSPESYGYDAVGNRTSSHLSASHTHNSGNQLTEDDSYTYTYDANGNLTSKTDKTTSDATTYAWDAQNQLIEIGFPNSTTAEYAYDGLGRRIEKDVAGTVRRYVYDGVHLAASYDGTNDLLARYRHGQRIDQILAMEHETDGDFFYQTDHLGSVWEITDDAGSTVNTYEYDAYGRLLSISESVENPFGYTGQQKDPESGLYYYRARYYQPRAGRFVAEDPVQLEGGDANLYRYVVNEPVNSLDPSGLTVYNNSPYPVKVRPETGSTGYIIPPHSSADVSPDAVQNPLTCGWTKFRGKSFLPDNDVDIHPDGQPRCMSGPCFFLPESEGPEIDQQFGNPPGGFSPYPDPKPLNPESCCGFLP